MLLGLEYRLYFLHKKINHFSEFDSKKICYPCELSRNCFRKCLVGSWPYVFSLPLGLATYMSGISVHLENPTCSIHIFSANCTLFLPFFFIMSQFPCNLCPTKNGHILPGKVALLLMVLPLENLDLSHGTTV